MLSEWLIDSLTNKWLTDWLTCQLTDLLTDWLANLLSGSVTECVTGLLTDWLTCWLTNLISWLTDWLADLLTDLPTNWLADWLNYLLMDSVTERTDWLTQAGLLTWLVFWFLMYCNRIIMLRDGPLEKWLVEGGGVFSKVKKIKFHLEIINKYISTDFGPKQFIPKEDRCR